MNWDRNNQKKVFDVTPGKSKTFKAFETRTKLHAPKVKKWNHQDELADSTGKSVVIVSMTGNSVMGELIAADQFTIKLRFDNKEQTFFKHSISSYLVK